MGDQSPQRTMNLDLNLERVVNSIQDFQPETMSFGDWLREAVSIREHFPPVWRYIPVPMGTGSTGPEMIKTNNNGLERSVKSSGDESSFFDCNICLDLASEPVVTCCGHLFCWPCIYRWLFVHSNAKECPICKGEVSMKTITPIYTRGNHANVTKVVDSSVQIPSRPQANRVESWRQSFQRNEINIPMFEMIRRLDNRFDLTRDTISDNPQETPSSFLINRIFTSRGIRTARDTVSGAEDLVLTSPSANHDPDPAGLNGGDTLPNLSSAESFVESYFRDHPDERNQDELSLIDTHSMSSVAGIIQSESQTTETDSISRRRRICESSTSRVSDGNSGETRSRRRRLH